MSIQGHDLHTMMGQVPDAKYQVSLKTIYQFQRRRLLIKDYYNKQS